MTGRDEGRREPAVIVVGDPSERPGDDIEQAVDRLGQEPKQAPPELPASTAEETPVAVEGTPDQEPRAGRRPMKKKGSLGQRVGLWLACYLLVAVMYIGFFSYPVPPAHLDGLTYTASEKVYQTLPYTYEIDYVSLSERSVVVVLTVRTIQVPDKAYSAALRNAEGITEDYLRQQYGLNVDVRYAGEGTATVEGHAAVRQDYDVYDTVAGPLGRTDTVLVARMSVMAWFCNENFISVAAGFFHRAAVSPAITENLRCH
jgi:hypothetical protein